ncbi:hypothetical protein [Microbacterium sp. NIBRBAC000506063]|uniref:hypothetical protein n=1 Tax=Microbacterium sp. NIBRBAC000506063 TaxID=2734618 RepID=UPI0039813664
MELLDRLVGAGDVREGHRRGLLGDELGLGLAELHDLSAAALHRREQPPEQQTQQQQRDEKRKDAAEE